MLQWRHVLTQTLRCRKFGSNRRSEFFSIAGFDWANHPEAVFQSALSISLQPGKDGVRGFVTFLA